MARFTIEDDTAPATAGFTIEDAPPTPKPTRAQLARETGRKMPSPARGAVTALQGPMFGLLDELTGGVQGAYKFFDTGDFGQAQQAYIENRDMIRGMEEKQRDEYPWLSTLTSIAASMPVMVAGPTIAAKTRPGMTAGQNLLARTLAAGGTAGGYGALTAAGQSEADDPSNLLSEILKGGASSAAMAGMMVPAGAAIGAGVGAGVRMIPRGAGGAGGTVGKLTPTGVGPEDFASRKVAQQLVRDMPESASIKDPAARSLAWQRYLGPDARIVDVGGKQTRSALNTLSALPGKTGDAATKAAEARMAGRGAAIMADADKVLGTNGASYKKAVDDLVASRAAAAKPLYDKLRTVSVTADDDLSSIINAARDLGALGEAKTMSTALRQRFTLADNPSTAGATMDMSDLDMVKRGLDQLVKKETDDVTGRVSPKGMAYQSLLADLRDKLDDLTTDPATGVSLYKSARDAFSGPSQLKNYMEIGRKLLKPDQDFRIEDAIKDASASEIDFMRIGLMQAIKEKAGTQTGQTWLMSNWKNPAIREKLQMAFGPDAPKFISALQKQQRLKLMEGSTSVGSQTEPIRAMAEDLGIEAVKDVGSAAAASKTGDVGGLWSSINRLYKRAEMPESVRDEMGRILLMKGPEARQKLMEMGKMMELIQQRQNATSATIGRGAGQNPWLTRESGQE